MRDKPDRPFGRLLKAGLNSIATIERRSGPEVDDEIGDLVGLAGTSIQRYRSGALPSDIRFTTVVAEACVSRGLMGRRWLELFLKEARFPHYEARALVARLFPEQSAPAAHSPTPRPSIPPPTYGRFIMRRAAYEAGLAGLAGELPLTAIVSMGGMGKSTLAQKIAHDCLEGQARPTFKAAVWVSDRDQPGTTNLSTFLDTVARVLDYPGIAALAAAEKQREIARLLAASPTLLILDNAETVGDSALLEWLSGLPAPSKALVTSRVAPPPYVPAYLVDLAPMDAGEAQALIAERVARSPALRRIPGVAAELAPLAAAAGGNPKAISLAIGLAQHQRLETILADLRDARNQQLFDDLFARAWGLLDAAAQRTLLAAALFTTDVDPAALAYCADQTPAAAEATLARLADLTLVDLARPSLSAPLRASLHPLVRAFASARLAERPAEEAALRRRWLAWCRDLAGQVGFCWDDLDRLDRLDSDHPTIQAALEWAATHGEDRAALEMAEGVRYYYNVRGLWDERRMANYPLRAAAARRLGDRSTLVLALSQHAEVLSKQDTLAAAAELLAGAEAAAAGAELSADAAFELGHARGLLAHARGDLAAAEGHWRALLPFAATLDPQKHVICRRWLATCLLDQGRIDEAERLYRASLDDARAANDTRSVTGNSLKLAAIDLGRGDLAAAAAALHECHAAASRHDDRRRLAEWAALSARLCVARADAAGAAAYLGQAADLFTRMGMPRQASAARGQLAQLAPAAAERRG